MPDSQQTRILPEELRSGAPNVGSILRERYRLDSELGRGGMGIVYRATDLELQRAVAVKVLSATASTSDARERLIREARSAAALNHELTEAERLCKEADELVGPTESRVSQLWLGPLYMDVLLEQKKRAEAGNDTTLAGQKLSEAKQRLDAYQELVEQCQSPRFTAEAQRLAGLLSNQL